MQRSGKPRPDFMLSAELKDGELDEAGIEQDMPHLLPNHLFFQTVPEHMSTDPVTS